MHCFLNVILREKVNQLLTVLVIGERRGSKRHQQERDHRLHSVSIGGRRGAERATRSHWPVVPGAHLCTYRGQFVSYRSDRRLHFP